MRDGHYLSTYLTPSGLPCLLRTWLRHDANVSLWEKSGSTIRLCRYWELERLTGVKYDGAALPHDGAARPLIDTLLRPEGLRFDDLVEIWGTPGIATVDDYHLVDNPAALAYHTVAHLYSAILLDSDLFYDGQILGLAADGGPDPVLERTIKPHWYAGGVVRRGDLTMFPVESPGTLWLYAARRFRIREGTLMALGSATEAAVQVDRRRILDRFSFTDQSVRDAAPAVIDLVVEEVRSRLQEKGGGNPVRLDARFSEHENFVSMVIKELQAISVAIMERNVEAIIDRFELDPASTHLALSGGFALNCPANSHLMSRYGFKSLLAPPCPNDGGQSLGIALCAFHRKSAGQRLSFRFPGPYLGMEDGGLETCLESYADFVDDVSALDLDQVVRDLQEDPVVWFSGRTEVGPRALGNRSILADPRTLRSNEVLNRLKGREWWRPVAPVVLEDHLSDWFEGARPSPFMLEIFTIRPSRRASVPAIAHLDHSARIQSLTRAQNPALFDLLTAFHASSGVPMLCNTSLNDKREPIINRIEEAINFCLRKGVRVACFNGRRLTFRHFDRYPGTRPLTRRLEPLTPPSVEEVAPAMTVLNPHGLPDSYLRAYLWNPVLRHTYDIASAGDANRLRRAIDVMFARYPDTRRRLKLYEERISHEAWELGAG